MISKEDQLEFMREFVIDICFLEKIYVYSEYYFPKLALIKTLHELGLVILEGSYALKVISTMDYGN